MNTITIKVGKVPGTIQEVAVETGTNVSRVLELANITDTTGYEVRVAGNNASFDTVLTEDTSVLLMKQIKGNSNITIKVGKVPGTIQEVVAEAGISVKEVLEVAGITDIQGYELRASGSNVAEDAILTQDTSLLLMKQIKGNSHITVKVGKVPGTISEVAVESGTSVNEVLILAGIMDATGYEVRVGGNNATFDTPLNSDTSVLLMKQIKDNR